MGSTGKGVKAGVIAGLIYGIVVGALSYFTLVSEKSSILAAIQSALPSNSPFTAQQLYGVVVLITPAIEAIAGIIGGIIVGAIYGRFFERIPGGTSVKKGILVGLVLWFLLSILGGLSNLRYGAVVYLGDAGVGIISALLFGYLLGYFYGRFIRPPTLDPAMQGL